METRKRTINFAKLANPDHHFEGKQARRIRAARQVLPDLYSVERIITRRKVEGVSRNFGENHFGIFVIMAYSFTSCFLHL